MLPLLQRLLQYLGLEANEVEVKVLTSLASVAESTDHTNVSRHFQSLCLYPHRRLDMLLLGSSLGYRFLKSGCGESLAVLLPVEVDMMITLWERCCAVCSVARKSIP